MHLLDPEGYEAQLEAANDEIERLRKLWHEALRDAWSSKHDFAVYRLAVAAMPAEFSRQMFLELARARHALTLVPDEGPSGEIER